MPLIPQAPSSYAIDPTCQIENFGHLLEALPFPFGGFRPDYQGRFVEVGSFDGRTYSNVSWAADAQWYGLMIEPMPENVAKLRAAHGTNHRIAIEPVACGEALMLMNLFFEREGSRVAKEGEPFVAVPVEPLDHILRRNQWRPGFEILVIDTEDHEQQVLRGFTLNYWRPLLCIIETHAPLRKIVHDVFDNDYQTYHEDGLNTLFTRKDWKP